MLAGEVQNKLSLKTSQMTHLELDLTAGERAPLTGHMRLRFRCVTRVCHTIFLRDNHLLIDSHPPHE